MTGDVPVINHVVAVYMEHITQIFWLGIMSSIFILKKSNQTIGQSNLNNIQACIGNSKMPKRKYDTGLESGQTT